MDARILSLYFLAALGDGRLNEAPDSIAHMPSIANEGRNISHHAIATHVANLALQRMGWDTQDVESSAFNCEWLLNDGTSREALQLLRSELSYKPAVDPETVADVMQRHYVHVGLFGILTELSQQNVRVRHLAMHRVGSMAVELGRQRWDSCQARGRRAGIQRQADSNISAALAITHLNPAEWMGYQHGLLIAAFAAHIREVHKFSEGSFWALSSSTAVCDRQRAVQIHGSSSATQTSLKTYASCIHGQGHAIMAHAATEGQTSKEALTNSMNRCLDWSRSAPTRGEACQAASGIMMQYSMELQKLHGAGPSEESEHPQCVHRGTLGEYSAMCFQRLFTGLLMAGKTQMQCEDIPGVVSGSKLHAACVFARAKIFYIPHRFTTNGTLGRFCGSFRDRIPWLELCVYGGASGVARNAVGMALLDGAHDPRAIVAACQLALGAWRSESRLLKACIAGIATNVDLEHFDPCGHKYVDAI